MRASSPGPAARGRTALGRLRLHGAVALASQLEARQRWAYAARAYRVALAARDDARLHARLGRVLERSEQWSEAEQAYRAAVARDPRAEWLSRLGRLLLRQRRWDEAAAALESVLQLDGTRTADWERLGRARGRLGQLDAAASAYRTWLDRDPTSTALARQLLDVSSERFPARRRVASFVAEHLDELREAAAAARAEAVPGPPRVWAYWGQGWDAAPAVVRFCSEQLRLHQPGAELVLLDDERLGTWVDLPPEVQRIRSTYRPAFSDALRIELLARHGGVWVDATCLVQGRLLDRLPELLPSGFFAFRWTTHRIANWALASEPGGYVVTLLRAAVHCYWRHHDRPVDYFFFHMMFEALYLLDEQFRVLWDATPALPADPPTRLQRVMLEPYDEQRLQGLLATSFVHKLRHKVEPETGPDGSMLAGLLDPARHPGPG